MAAGSTRTRGVVGRWAAGNAVSVRGTPGMVVALGSDYPRALTVIGQNGTAS